jgi:hypothetical protein
MINKNIKPLNESRGTYVSPSNVQPPPKPQHRNKPKTEMTTYNLLILDKAIQHHYESTAVICPSQEEVENALKAVTIELQDLKELNAELLISLEAVSGMLKNQYRTKGIEEIEQLIETAIKTSKRYIR